ncbi:MAG: nicotinate phosphoribosyltransferase, partial [Cyanobacteriota bacterium]|nr:nicotinate phosphoribosyltransferase [Cyanobacteriota bacterium]
QVRDILPGVSIFASGDIDEWEIARLKQNNAQIDGYGIGTKLVTGNPVNGVYKLVEIDGIPVMKQSSGKVSYPGRKQIFREFVEGQLKSDTLGLFSENHPGKKPLLKLFMKDGKRLEQPNPINEIKKISSASVTSLPPHIRNIDSPTSIPVEISPYLQKLTKQIKKSTKH